MSRAMSGTAADLLAYNQYNDAMSHLDAFTRVATANLEWVVRDWDGEQYIIRFDKNFSKKHLFAFSKKENNTRATATAISQRPGRAADAAADWHDAEMELLQGKIASNLDKRAVSDVCRCGHKFSPAHNPGGGACTNAACVGAAVPCANFQTPYSLNRQVHGKPTHDPLAGAKTSKNTCIILNWVPCAEFENVVVQSIQSHEKPPGWTQGNALAVPHGPAPGVGAHPPNSRLLRWDFGLGRRGAIVVAEKLAAAPWYNHANFQGCYVHAYKSATAWGRQNWVIYHMNTQAPNLPF